MRLEVLVEDESTKVIVDVILERLTIATPNATWLTSPAGDKERMWRTLRGRLQAFARGRYADAVIVVLDQDRRDCIKIKNRAARMAAQAGMTYEDGTATIRQFALRVAQPTPESWLLGDAAAIRAAYPNISSQGRLVRKDVDRLANAADTLHQVLKRGGYFPHFLPKVSVAEEIAPHLNLTLGTNQSHSFGVFLKSLYEFLDRASTES